MQQLIGHTTVTSLLLINTLQPAIAGLAGFGGDYGEYLELLKGNDVLDKFGGGGLEDIEEGQARQEAVMGGEEDELKAGFLRHLNIGKKDKKGDVHLNFDVNVFIVNKNTTPETEAMIKDNIEKLEKVERESSPGAPSPGGSQPEAFDWKAYQSGGSGPWENKAGGQTGGGASGGWGGQTGGGQTGGAPAPPPSVPPSAQASNIGQRSLNDIKLSRGMGGKWIRELSKDLPKQLVVVLSPKMDIVDQLTMKMKETMEKDNKTNIHELIKSMKKNKVDKFEEMKEEKEKLIEEELKKLGFDKDLPGKIKKNDYGSIDFNKEFKMYKNKESREYSRSIDDSATNESENEVSDLIDKFLDAYEDPLIVSSHLPTPYKNMSISGLSTMTICSLSTPGHTWKVSLCIDTLTASVSVTSGPNMPFNGKVTAVYTGPKMNLMLTKSKDLLHVSSVTLSSDATKFIPNFESAVPLNPWSKVSLGGYMVAKAKKVISKLAEKELTFAFKELE